jgi:hypothetical protein
MNAACSRESDTVSIENGPSIKGTIRHNNSGQGYALTSLRVQSEWSSEQWRNSGRIRPPPVAIRPGNRWWRQVWLKRGLELDVLRDHPRFQELLKSLSAEVRR